MTLPNCLGPLRLTDIFVLVASRFRSQAAGCSKKRLDVPLFGWLVLIFIRIRIAGRIVEQALMSNQNHIH